MKNILLLVISLAALSFLFASCNNAFGAEDELFETDYLQTKEVNYCYLEDTILKNDKMTLYFMKNSEIPYVEPSVYFHELFGAHGTVYNVTQTDYVYTITNENVPNKKYNYLTIDFETAEVSFPCYSWFINSGTTKAASVDITIADFLNKEVVKDVLGDPLTINLSKYKIPLQWDNGHGFIPLQTIVDLIHPLFPVVYNGQNTFHRPAENFQNSEFREKYFENKKETISQELANFNYQELCLLLDMRYGLKKSRGISDFDSWFETIGVKENLKSVAPLIFDKKLAEVILCNIDDIHSNYVLYSPLNGFDLELIQEFEEQIKNYSENAPVRSGQDKIATQLRGITDREGTQIIKGVRTVESMYDFYVSGNIAFINIDKFTLDSIDKATYSQFNWDILDSLNDTEWDSLIELKGKENTTIESFITHADQKGWNLKNGFRDTVCLTVFTNYFIKRINENASDNNKIKNVVLDLSTNSGGAVDAMLVMTSWFGGYAVEAVSNATDGSASAVKCTMDINFDGNYDENDNIADLNRLCITSPASFSCGNWMPTILSSMPSMKDVTFIGQRSGGGTCAVDENIATATGTIFNLSNPYVFSIFENDIFNNVEEGVEVTHPVSDYTLIYARNNFKSNFDDYLVK